MDSLTQIVLGAAVGEAVLGRRIGNRAMMWGAIGGTIPDLDVIANFTMSELEALAVHRGITHSIFFAVVMAFLVAWLVHRLYLFEIHRRKSYKIFVTSVNALLLGLIALGIFSLTRSWLVLIPVAVLALWMCWRLITRYVNGMPEPVVVPYRSWCWLFFLAFITHILLDSFTAFGTQVFLPFSDYRLALNSIAVADPVYTFPFLIMIVMAATRRRKDPDRRLLTWLGIGLSSLYLLTTVINKQRVEQVLMSALEHRQIAVERCRTSPTILNNILWNCVAEDPDAFYVGLYSLYDSNPHIHVLNRLPKNHALVDEMSQYPEFETLQWFADDYLLPTRISDSVVILADLRYGAFGDTIMGHEDMVFSFITKPGHSRFELEQRRPRPENFAQEFGKFTRRILGY